MEDTGGGKGSRGWGAVGSLRLRGDSGRAQLRTNAVWNNTVDHQNDAICLGHLDGGGGIQTKAWGQPGFTKSHQGSRDHPLDNDSCHVADAGLGRGKLANSSSDSWLVFGIQECPFENCD